MKEEISKLVSGFNCDINDDNRESIEKEVAEFMYVYKRQLLEEIIKVIRNSRTTSEEYGVGMGEETARCQAITDILVSLEGGNK